MEKVINVPLRKQVMKSPMYLRAKKAVSTLRAYVAKHMNVDEKNVKIGEYANKLLWKRGMKSPPHHIKVKCVSDDKGIVKAEILEAPQQKETIDTKADKPAKEKEKKESEKEKKIKEKEEEKAEQKESKETEK